MTLIKPSLLLHIVTLIILGITINGSFGNLFMCPFNAHRVHIDIACDENERIHIANTWTMKLNKYYRYCKDMTMEYYKETSFGQKYGVSNHMMHGLITKCSGQRSCRVLHYTDYVMPGEGASRDNIGIVIKYECIPALDFIPFCEDMSNKRLYTSTLPIFLVHHYKGIPTQGTCNCDVTYTGLFDVTLTIVPTDREYLKTTTWTRGSNSREQHFNDRVYKNEAIAHNPETERYTVVNRETKTTNESAFILVQIAAHDSNSYFEMQCFGPNVPGNIHQTTQRSKKAGALSAQDILYVFGPAVLVICLSGIGIGLFVLHHRCAGKRKQRVVNMPSGTDAVNPDGATVDTRSFHTTLDNDSIGSCSQSYLEVGSSASGYAHCSMPGGISQQDISVQIHYNIADEDNYQTQEQGPSDDEVSEGSIHVEVINDQNDST